MPLAQLMEHDTETTHAVLIAGTLAHLPNDSSETDSNGVSIEQDLIDVDDWMLAGLPNTGYEQPNKYGLVANVDF